MLKTKRNGASQFQNEKESPERKTKDQKKVEPVISDHQKIMMDSQLPIYYYIKNFNYMLENQKRIIETQPPPKTPWTLSMAEMTPIELNKETKGMQKFARRLEGVISETKNMRYDLRRREKERDDSGTKKSSFEENVFFDKELPKITKRFEKLMKKHKDLTVPDYAPGLFFSFSQGNNISKFKTCSIDLGLESPLNWRNSQEKSVPMTQAEKKLYEISEKNPVSKKIQPIFNSKSIYFDFPSDFLFYFELLLHFFLFSDFSLHFLSF